MELAILVFFLAIFGGILFLLGLVWFLIRRAKKQVSGRRNFSGRSGHAGGHAAFDDHSSDFDDQAAYYAGGSLLDDRLADHQGVAETARDSARVTDNSYSHESHGAFAAPAETSSSAYESSSSYDSGSSSSYDSGSSSSDSSSSSSSSSD